MTTPPARYRDDGPEIPPLTDDEGDVESQNQDLHVRSASDTSEHGLPVPVWLRESAKSFRYKWVPLPLRKAGRAIAKWVKGPQPPIILKIEPFFPNVQEAPINLLERYVPKRRHRAFLFVTFFAIWFLVWSLMLKNLSTAGYIEGYGKPNNIWCGYSFWRENNQCGLNGNDCRPFSKQYLAFRCPAMCETTHLLEEHVIGNKSVEFSTLVIGGPKKNEPDAPPIYRGDSFICQAGIHAGVISNSKGGCGVAVLVGGASDFEASKHHGIQSLDFPSTFPRSFTFEELSDSQAQCPVDSRWGIFSVTAVALVILSLFTTSPAAFFWGTFVILMFHVGLVSDPPNRNNFLELLSTLAGRLLPAAFVAAILYRWCARPLLTGLTAQVEKTILYLGFCLLGALNNYTFAILIPIERLTPHDLAQPGAGTALAIIIVSILAIVISQIHWIRISGNMPRYLVVYALMGVTLIILLALPGMRLRIHHYILGILFMPGTAFKVRPSLAYQGLLLGFFINGIARWGFDSIIQTPAALGEAGGGRGKSWWGAEAPNITAEVAHNNKSITFNWGYLPTDTGVDGVSILINDVERWRGYIDEELFLHPEETTIRRRKREKDEPEFFRFAWMSGNAVGRYSKVGIWDEHNIWHPIPS